MFVYCHLDLVSRDHGAVAREFHRRFGDDHLLLHGDVVRSLRGLATPAHLAKDSTAKTLRENRLPVRCCKYTFDLLLKYLHNANQIALLAVLNAHVAVTVTVGDPEPHADEEDIVARNTITGQGPPSKTDAFNASKEGRWGVLVDCVELQAADEFEEEKIRTANAKKERERKSGGGGGGEGGEGEDDDKEGGGEEKEKSTPTKSKKKAAADAAKEKEEAEAAEKEKGPELTIVSSEVPVPELSYEARWESIEDIRYRARISKDALPSCAFYTFTHAHEHLVCATTSSDAALVVGGFQDSVVRVWDMNKSVPGGTDKYDTDPASRKRLKRREAGYDQLPDGDDDDDDDDDEEFKEKGGGGDGEIPAKGTKVATPLYCKEYIGHSSAVHAVSLSPGNEFLLSCSRDSTVRAWSMQLEMPLCAYRSHNYPVWDVKWAPTGHYFASASHDKTARVWAMDVATPRRIMVGHLADVDVVTWHPNCNYIATRVVRSNFETVGRVHGRVRANFHRAPRRDSIDRDVPRREVHGLRQRRRRDPDLGPRLRQVRTRVRRARGRGVFPGLRRRRRDVARVRRRGRDRASVGRHDRERERRRGRRRDGGGGDEETCRRGQDVEDEIDPRVRGEVYAT